MTTFGIVHRFPGGTREQYENVLEVVPRFTRMVGPAAEITL